LQNNVLRSTPGRIRTCNQRIRNPLLYPLSYGRNDLRIFVSRYHTSLSVV
jgi:hypothetical protein